MEAKSAGVWPLAAIILGMAASSLQAGQAKFEPAEGKVLLMVGQNLEEIKAYTDAAKSLPAGLMVYTSLNQGNGLTEPFNEGDGTQHAQRLITENPNTALQIGVYMVDQCADAAEGKMDAAIDKLGDWIRKTRRPVFLRAGYEFDGPHNHYPPEDYVKAYHRLVDRFRRRGVRNVAYVWHSYASVQTRPLYDWYPGDDSDAAV